jgi:hypothetical protein
MLVIVLMVLLLLSILGATVLIRTTSDLRISGNYRNTQESFYRADGGIQYYLANYNNFIEGTEDTARMIYIDATNNLADDTVLPGGATNLVDVATRYLFTGTGGLEPGNSQDVKTHHYSVTMVGHGVNNGEVTIETEIGKADYESGGNVLYN